MIVKARFVVPVEGPVIANGAVAFENGRIVAVGPAAFLGGDKIVDYGDAVILPGFVNAHTHLELSLLAGRVPPSPDFVAWLERLIAARSGAFAGERLRVEANAADGTPESEYAARAVRLGVAESLAAGVTVVGDITAFPAASRAVLARTALSAVSFGEVIAMGSGRSMLAPRLDAALQSNAASPNLRIGVSPHAPYTVEPEAMRMCAERARQRGARTCIHVAETREEEDFTRNGGGPFADFLRRLGLWDEAIPASGCSPVALCDSVGILGSTTLLAHANYVSDADIALIAARGAGVAFCPRTHRAFGHAPHRFRDMARAGVNVCVGTDSLASNPSLSILDELRFLRDDQRDMSADELIAMGTIRGARALGVEDSHGSIEPGKSADLAVLPLIPSGRNRWASVLESDVAPLAVYAGGVRQSTSAAC